MSHHTRYTDFPQGDQHQRHMSMGSDAFGYGHSPQNQSQDNLLSGFGSPSAYAQPRTRSPLGTLAAHSRPGSTNQLSGFQTQGVSNDAITMAIRECLNEVDLDTVTKKQLKALAEQKLQCQLPGDKRAFLDSQIDLELANM
jgi:chitin synthase